MDTIPFMDIMTFRFVAHIHKLTGKYLPKLCSIVSSCHMSRCTQFESAAGYPFHVCQKCGQESD